MTKENLIQHIEAMKPEQIELLGALLNFANGWFDRKVLYQLCGITEDQASKIDSAFPCDYAKSIREIYPEFDEGIHCFDYNEKSFGYMRNLNNSFVKNLQEKLKIKTL